MTLESFNKYPQKQLRAICEFLQIDPNFLFSDAGKVRNSGAFFNTPETISKLTQNKFVAKLKKYIPRILIRKLRDIITEIFGRKKIILNEEKRFTLNDAEKTLIIDALKDDLPQLRDVYGIDIEQDWPEVYRRIF